MRRLVVAVLAALLLVYVFGLALMMAATPATGAAPATCNAIVHRAKLAGHDELQPAGITASARWGWGAELDARVTSDGKVILVHDDTYKRVTGGVDTRQPESLTFKENRAVVLEHGGRPAGLWAALKAAKRVQVKLMVEVKRYPAHKQAWNDHGFGYIANAIAKTGMTERVFVGGGGAGAFHQVHPGFRGFIRVDPDDPTTTAAGIDAMTWHPSDLIQVGASHYDADLIKALRGLGHGVASRNAFTAEQVAAGYAAGLRTFQEDRGGRLRNHCQEAAR